MKKLLIIASLFFIKSAERAIAQTLAFANNNMCSATINFDVTATDGTLPCGSESMTTLLFNGTGTAPEDIHDFDATGGAGGPLSWNSGGNIGSGAAWAYGVVTWVGGSTSVTVGSASYTCMGTLHQLISMTSGGCTVNVLWNENASGDVSITAY